MVSNFSFSDFLTDDVYEREDMDVVEPDAVEEDGGRDAVEDEDDEEDGDFFPFYFPFSFKIIFSLTVIS